MEELEGESGSLVDSVDGGGVSDGAGSISEDGTGDSALSVAGGGASGVAGGVAGLSLIHI